MTLEADEIVERRRLKRSRALWRFGAIAGLILLALSGSAALGIAKFGLGAHVAKLSISGIILDDDDVIKAIDGVADDDSAKAVLVMVNSPGGTVTGSEAIYNALRRVAAKKPVIAVQGSLAAS